MREDQTLYSYTNKRNSPNNESVRGWHDKTRWYFKRGIDNAYVQGSSDLTQNTFFFLSFSFSFSCTGNVYLLMQAGKVLISQDLGGPYNHIRCNWWSFTEWFPEDSLSVVESILWRLSLLLLSHSTSVIVRYPKGVFLFVFLIQPMKGLKTYRWLH